MEGQCFQGNDLKAVFIYRIQDFRFIGYLALKAAPDIDSFVNRFCIITVSKNCSYIINRPQIGQVNYDVRLNFCLQMKIEFG